jgi:hypothetical protein
VFYNQPLAVRFGTELLRHIDPVWDQLDIAVAWVRASGMVYLSDRFASFLRHGGALSIIVGIDLENTTREGLQALLDLEQYGACEIFVYHNESDSVFHPKLYLWRNEEEARLIVGSNNITQSGLYINVEAGLQVDTPVDDPVIVQVLDALSSWKSDEGGLAKRLDSNLLAQLVAGGYVPNEAAVRASISQRRTARTARSGSRLFGARRFVPPAPPAVTVATPVTGQAQTQPTALPATPVASPAGGVAPAGTVLLMRLRKASVTDRPTQTQIPFRVVDTFFQGATAVRSAHDGVSHGIIAATARGNRNTIKLEIPEMRDFAQPLARFERTPNGIVYEAYDVGSPQGNQILQSLQAGQQDGTTQQSIRDPQRATWWRFI